MTPNRRLKQARELRGWSQAKVAEQIGTDATTVSRWERGLFSPTPYFRERLCTLFNKNAAELGLLDIEYEPDLTESRVLTSRPPTSLPFQPETESLHTRGSQTSTIAPPAAPSWPRRGDTFGYILDSAAHDQQAHTLWEDAYVRVMRGQRAEAQILGEASLNAFEHVGHPNAEALREWLKKNELLSDESSTPTRTSEPLPLLAKPPKRTVKQMFRRRSIGLAIILMALTAVSLTGYILNRSAAPSVQAGVQNSPVTVQHTQLPGSDPTSFATASSATAAATRAPATPKARPTKPPAAPTNNPPASSSLMLTISPASLTPSKCMPDQGYRCTLTLNVFSKTPGPLSWKSDSTGIAAVFSTTSGTTHSGDVVQVIVYIQSQPGQRGQLIFTLQSSTSSLTKTVSWQG